MKWPLALMSPTLQQAVAVCVDVGMPGSHAIAANQLEQLDAIVQRLATLRKLGHYQRCERFPNGMRILVRSPDAARLATAVSSIVKKLPLAPYIRVQTCQDFGRPAWKDFP
jgi:hypothetical protein